MKDLANCPYCQAEANDWSESWAMTDEAWEEMKRIHEEKHNPSWKAGDYPLAAEVTWC